MYGAAHRLVMMCVRTARSSISNPFAVSSVQNGCHSVMSSPPQMSLTRRRRGRDSSITRVNNAANVVRVAVIGANRNSATAGGGHEFGASLRSFPVGPVSPGCRACCGRCNTRLRRPHPASAQCRARLPRVAPATTAILSFNGCAAALPSASLPRFRARAYLARSGQPTGVRWSESPGIIPAFDLRSIRCAGSHSGMPRSQPCSTRTRAMCARACSSCAN